MKGSPNRRIGHIKDLALIINPNELWMPMSIVLAKKKATALNIYEAIKAGKLDCRGIRTAKKTHLFVVVNTKFVRYKKEKRGKVNINELISFLNNELRNP